MRVDVSLGPVGRLFASALADSVKGVDLTEELVWDALDAALSASVQRLWTVEDHPTSARAAELWHRLSTSGKISWWKEPMAVRQIGLEDLSYAGPKFGRPDGWWSTPADVILTSRLDPASNSCVHLRHRDGYDWEPTRPLIWDAETSSARVYEVGSIDSWRKLVEWAPRQVETDLQVPRELGRARQFQPDWSLVASRYDAVHVPIMTLLTAAYQPIVTSAGFTFLTGWHPDVSAWLNPGDLFREGPRSLRLAEPQRSPF